MNYDYTYILPSYKITTPKQCQKKCTSSVHRPLFKMDDALLAASILGVTFEEYTPEEFLTGINIELEHGLVNPQTNVTDDELITTAKIALAHLNELPNYYNPKYGLLAFEKFLESQLKNEK